MTKSNLYRALVAVLILLLAIQAFVLVRTNAATTVIQKLEVPYINQCLNKDQKTFYPNLIGSNNRVICRNMCLTSAMVMVAGYFGKVDFDRNNTDTLKKYLIEDNDIPERVRDAYSTIGGAFGLTSYTGADGNNSDNYVNGAVDYALRKGLVTDGIKWIPSNPESAKTFIYNNAKAAIDRKNVVLIATTTHARVIRGYTNDGQIVVNDSYRNTEIGRAGDKFNYNGRDAIYDLPTSGTSRPENPVEQFQYMVEFGDSNPNFYSNGGSIPPTATLPPSSRINQTVQVTNPNPSNGWTTINVRNDIAGSVFDTASFGTKGVVTSRPFYGKGFYREKVRFDNGVEGWMAVNFLKTSTANQYENINLKVSNREPLNVRSDTSLDSNVITTLPQFSKGVAVQKTTQTIFGYTWYLVKWENGITGWSVGNYLDK